MKNNKNTTSIIQMSESYLIAMLLTITGGYLDVYTYITRDKVFANAQTGNIVLFAINFANKNFKDAFNYFIPILSFMLGVILSDFIKNKFYSKRQVHWRQLTILFEILVLIFVSTLKDSSTNMLANILISFVCSIQVESFRKFKGSSFASTMCTGNLRSASENLFNFFNTKDKKYIRLFFSYLGIIFFFILGAVISIMLTNIYSINSILFCVVPLSIAFLLMFKNKNKISN